MEISHDAGAIERHLRTAKTIAVVGLSDDEYRASYEVSRYMQNAGYRILPVNPTLPSNRRVLGELPYASLEAIPPGISIDIINVFRRPADVPRVAEAALRRRAPLFWMQLGIRNEAAARMLLDHDYDVVQSRCIKVDHATLIR